MATGARATDPPWGVMLPTITAAALLAGWLPAAAMALAGLLAWSGTGATALQLTIAGGALVVLAEAMRTRLATARAEAARLRSLLADERAMLCEVQHRTANALQFLASLLSLQAERIGPAGGADEALREAATRLGAVARVHRRLHGPLPAGGVLHDLLRDLVVDILAARGLGPRVDDGVQVMVSVADAAAGLDPPRATAAALIVAESVTNAAKHAFDADGRGRLGIRLERRGEDFVLSVTDDGPGPPGVAPRADSLGMMVMESMSRRLAGSFRFGPGPQGGAEVCIVFPVQVARVPSAAESDS